MYFLQNGAVEILMDDPVTASEQRIGRLATFSAAPHFGQAARGRFWAAVAAAAAMAAAPLCFGSRDAGCGWPIVASSCS